MNQILGQYISQGLTILIQVALLLVITLLTMLKNKVAAYLKAHLDTNQMQLLELIGKQAYSFAETAYKELDGPEKLSVALDYFEKEVSKRGIPFDPAQAKQAIEQAWLQIEGLQKRIYTDTQQNPA